MTSLLIPESSNYKKDLNYYLVNNKMNYFIYDNCFKESSIKANTKGSEDSETNSSVNYLSDEYPFLHIEDTKDVLGQFLNKSSKKPNIVFILTESLSAAFTGRDAYLGSFTPFLDSLIERGLYWKNFLSSSGRTFGVTPAVLGSLPFGNNGFLELGTKAPDHLSIIRLLKENGYYCSFYYGGDPHFDLMDVFLKKENTDFIMQQKDFGSGYVKFPSNSGGFTWGYADREVFRKSFEIMKKSNKEPRLDIYMTLAMHSPFTLPDMAYYVKKSMDRMKTLGLADGEKANEYIKAKEKYACIMYTDDAIRYLINEYKKRDDFKNTIFIITGDHRMVEIPIASKIDKFHVPFIIYSPLVKQKEVFESVSTHQDIAPTLLAFLRDNYNMKFPPKSSWLGQGIDINKSFRNIHTSAFMWDKNDLYSFLDKDYFINDNQLFKLSRNMNIDPITNDTILARLQAKFNKFKEINAYVCENNRLYPDKDPDINTNIKLLQDSKIPKLEESILQSSNPQIFKSSNLIEAYKSIYVLTSFGLSSVPYSPQQMPELSINIFDNKNEKIYTEIIKLKSKGENKSKSGDWQIINIKKYINLSGKNQNVGSYISITLNNINKTKLNLNNLSIKIYGEK